MSPMKCNNLIVGRTDHYTDLFCHYPQLKSSLNGFTCTKMIELNWTLIDLTKNPNSHYDCSFYEMKNHPQLHHYFSYIVIDPACNFDLIETLETIQYIIRPKGWVNIPFKQLPQQLTQVTSYLDCFQIPLEFVVDSLPDDDRFVTGKFYLTYEERDSLSQEYETLNRCCGLWKQQVDNGYVRQFIKNKEKGYQEWYYERIRSHFPVSIKLVNKTAPGIYKGCGLQYGFQYYQIGGT